MGIQPVWIEVIFPAEKVQATFKANPDARHDNRRMPQPAIETLDVEDVPEVINFAQLKF